MRMVHALIGALVGVGTVVGSAGAAEARVVETEGVVAARSLAVLVLEGTPAEYQHGFNWIGEGSDTLLGLITTIDTLAFDPEFGGLVIRLKGASLSSTQIEELGAAMERYRDEGKKIHLFSEYYDPGALLLGSYADEVILQEGGFVSFPGIHMEEMYLASMLEWVGVKAQLVQVGDYKGANETMTRSEPSEAWDRNISSLLDAMYGEMRAKLKDGRRMTDRELDRAMEEAWSASGEEAMEVGLIDSVVDLPELKVHLSDEYNTEISWVTDPYDVGGSSAPDFSNPFALFTQMSKPRTVSIDHPTIAVLHIFGTIVDGDSSEGGMFGGGTQTGSRTIRNAIEDIIKEDEIEGVIIRINSPGGSAIASEVMWQGLERLREHKPVWVSVGNMAASGGYYVLSGGEKVYVNPSSVVGSIGVVGGKYAMGNVYEKLKINVVERSRGPVSELMSSSSPWDARQVALVREEMTETYDLFTSRVKAGRRGIDLSETAEGRLFLGERAIELKMADEIGGIDDAINDLADELDMGDYDVVHYPEPPSFDQVLREMLGGFMEAPVVSVNPVEATLRAVLGEDRYTAIVDQLNAMMLLRDEKVLLVSPHVFIVR